MPILRDLTWFLEDEAARIIATEMQRAGAHLVPSNSWNAIGLGLRASEFTMLSNQIEQVLAPALLVALREQFPQIPFTSSLLTAIKTYAQDTASFFKEQLVRLYHMLSNDGYIVQVTRGISSFPVLVVDFDRVVDVLHQVMTQRTA